MLARFLLTFALLSFLTITIIIAAYQVAYFLAAFIFIMCPILFTLWWKSRKEMKGEKSRTRR